MKTVPVFLIASLLLITVFSCSKTNTTPAPSTTSWTINGTKYTSNSVDRSTAGGNFQLEVNADNYIEIYFSTVPAASGSFKVVSMDKALSNTLASNEIAVGFGVGSTDSYISAGTDNVSATVTVGSNGKLKVVIPSFAVEHINSTSGPVGVTTASATVVEQ